MIEKIQSQNESDIEGKALVDFLYLVSCVLHDVIPDTKRIESMNLPRIYQMSRFHLLSAITCMALESACVFEAYSPIMEDEAIQELARKWKEQKNKAVRKNLLLDTERKELFSIMEQEGIWYLPLKGIILKDFYPKVGMRQMADNDILFDSKFQWKLKEIMEERGFTAVAVGKGNHDVYEKKPIYNFEMHTSLYGKGHKEEWVSYYENVVERLIPDTDSKYGYHFTDEDFYVYIITHACKHYNGSGTGIRSLLDIYVYLLKKEASLDWDYILGELIKLHVEEFEAACRGLAQKLFSQDVCELTVEEAKLLTYFLGSGTYGTLKNRVEKELQEYQPDGQPIRAKTRKKYMLKRLFPGEEHYRQYAPFAYRHKWFRPFFVLFRMIRGILRNSRKIVSEIKVVIKI